VTAESLLFIHFVAALVMTAVIWFVQLVEYPLFAYVGEAAFPEYAAEYQRRISWIVIGPMLVEVATAAGLAAWHPDLYRLPAFQIATLLLVVVWASTFLWQTPTHQRLLKGLDRATVSQLVRSNWLRTVAWTARAILVGWVFWNRSGL
jgi:hypothetical protein